MFDPQERLTIGKNPESEEDMIPEGEIILTINVFYPDIFEKVSSCHHSHYAFLHSFPMTHFLPQFNFIRPHATLLMTGSHTLAELRDAICCVSDLQVYGEFSNNPDAAPAFISKVSESGVFIARLKMSHLRPGTGVLSHLFCFRITSSRPSFTSKGCFIMT